MGGFVPAHKSLWGNTPSGILLPETLNFVSAMTVKPSGAQVTAYNVFIASLIAAGVWSKLGSVFWRASHDQQAALINMRNPAHLSVPVNSPTFTPGNMGGFNSNGTTSYLTNGIFTQIPGFTQNNACFGIWVTDDISNSNLAGSLSDVVRLRKEGSCRINTLGAGSLNGASGTGSRHWTLVRTGAAAQQLFINGSSAATDTSASQAVSAELWFELRSGGGYAPSAIRSHAAWAGASLSLGEATSLRAALITLMASL